jgi:hypothetical protein
MRHDLFRVGAEARLKPFHRVAKDVAHADVAAGQHPSGFSASGVTPLRTSCKRYASVILAG